MSRYGEANKTITDIILYRFAICFSLPVWLEKIYRYTSPSKVVTLIILYHLLLKLSQILSYFSDTHKSVEGEKGCCEKRNHSLTIYRIHFDGQLRVDNECLNGDRHTCFDQHNFHGRSIFQQGSDNHPGIWIGILRGHCSSWCNLMGKLVRTRYVPYPKNM